ncbi:MAG TPA: hypothetical protein H9782_01800 [Candidatus Bariatricus faecipullorum]|nr:hypothetical protein [Candidatus Bariatricus faecipullorum]
MKKRWIVAVVLSGAAAGVMIYDGGKLLLGYRDIWQGGMALFAGFLQIPLFAWSIFRSVPGKETQWEESAALRKRLNREILGNNLCAAFAVMGLLWYRMRYWPLWVACLLAAVVLVFSAGFTALELVLQNQRPLREWQFASLLGKYRVSWEQAGRCSFDSTAETLFRCMAEARSMAEKTWGFGIPFLLAVFLDSALQPDMPVVRCVLAAVVYFAVIMFAGNYAMFGASREVSRVMNEGNAQSILGFYLLYYENAKGRTQSLAPQIQTGILNALFLQGAYEEMLEFLKVIPRRPALEFYLLQYEWLACEGLRDCRSCQEIAVGMRRTLSFVNRKNRDRLEQTVRVLEAFSSRRYQEVLHFSWSPAVSELQKTMREKLMEDARNQVFGPEESR